MTKKISYEKTVIRERETFRASKTEGIQSLLEQKKGAVLALEKKIQEIIQINKDD